MRHLAAGAALLAVVGFGTPAHAAAAPLGLRAAVAYALAHDPGVLAKRATLAQNEAAYAKQHAAEFPSVAGLLQNQLYKSNGNTGGQFAQVGLSQAQVFSQNTAQIGSTWTLYNGSLAQLQAQEAKRQADAARSDEQRAEQQLASDVATAWYAAVQQREALRLAQSDLAYQQQLLATARAQERVGRVAGVDVLRAQANELKSEAALSSAGAADVNARESLAQRIGAPPDTAFALPQTLPEPQLPAQPLAALVTRALAARPDIASAQQQVALAKLADSALESDRRPVLQLQGSFGHQETPTTRTTSDRIVPGFGFIPGTPRTGPGFWQLGATETFSLPILDYGARHAAHRAAHAQIDAAQAALDVARSAVEVDVRQALRAAQTANANLVYERQADRYATEAARIAQLQYGNGLISLTDATAAQNGALSAASDLVTARVNALDALVRLNVAIGVADPLAIVAPGAP